MFGSRIIHSVYFLIYMDHSTRYLVEKTIPRDDLCFGIDLLQIQRTMKKVHGKSLLHFCGQLIDNVLRYSVSDYR